jgi:P2-related tail formation protein
MNPSSIPDHDRLDDNITTSYLPDLDRLTHNHDDEVKMTMTAYKTLVNNILTINQNLERNQEAFASIKRNNQVNEDLAKEMENIISSLKPKKRAKFGTKENLIPDIRFISTAEKYEETINSSPRTPLTPVPDYNEVFGKLLSNLI